MASPMRYAFKYKCPLCKNYVTWSDIVFKDRDHYCFEIRHAHKLKLVKIWILLILFAYNK